MRWVVLVLMMGCGGSSSSARPPASTQEHWSGFIDTSSGRYSAALFIGGGLDAGYYSASAPGLSGSVEGELPAVTVLPDRCDGGFQAMIDLNGDAAVISYSGATCADAESGTGTLWKY